jgi:hypothetical protein
VVFINSDLALGFEFYLNSTPAVFQSSPCNFETPYLFNRNSVLSDFCAKSFVATKAIWPLHNIIEITLFAILFHLFLLYCLFLACRSSRRK